MAIFDSASPTLRYTSCGAESGLCRSNSGEIQELEATGPVFGVFAEAEFAAGQFLLAPGDAIALFTDGLSEAGRRRHDFLEVKGLANLLSSCCGEVPAGSIPAEAVVDSLIQGVTAHTRGEAHDDMCMLVLVAVPTG